LLHPEQGNTIAFIVLRPDWDRFWRLWRNWHLSRDLTHTICLAAAKNILIEAIKLISSLTVGNFHFYSCAPSQRHLSGKW